MLHTLLTSDMVAMEVQRRLGNLGVETSEVKLVFDPLSSRPDVPVLIVRSGDRYAQVHLADLHHNVDQCLTPAVEKCKELLADARLP